MTGIDLPLVKRELLQRAQQRRTYAMRCLVLFVLAFIFMIPMISLRYRNTQFLLGSLGHGRDLVSVIFITLGCILYAVGPAMSCGAISSEKERQTLALLLVSRLSAITIILEKLTAQLIPLVVFLTLSVPLLAVSYLFGGISFAQISGGFLLLCMLAVHIVAISVFWSALLPSGLAAFWATYLTLFATSFGLALARESAAEIGPVFANLFDMLLVPLAIFQDDATERPFILFPMYHVTLLTGSFWSVPQALIAAIPFNVLSLMTIGASRWALLKYGDSGKPLLARSVADFFARAPKTPTLNETTPLIGPMQPTPSHSIGPTTVPLSNGIAWRETRRLFKYRRFYLAAVSFLLLWYWSTGTGNSRHYIWVSAVFTICFLIFSHLVVFSLSCRLFVTERERQTLDSLLTCPLTSRDLLRQKLAGVHTAVFWQLGVCALIGIIRILGVPFVRSASIFSHRFADDYSSELLTQYHSVEWFGKSATYMLAFLLNAFIYMQIVKWVAVWFSLKARGQMKAMLGTLLTILFICFGPMIFCVFCLVAIESSPNDFPFFYFTSPILIEGFLQMDELQQVYRRNWFPNSDMQVIVLNFLVYGGLALCLRQFVLTDLHRLLERRDSV